MKGNRHVNAKVLVLCVLLSFSSLTSAQVFEARPDTRIVAKISKTGLNRISNPPYQIIQVTGDESKFRIKYDQDGKNIYLMPLSLIGDSIEISVKNNIGSVQDLELIISETKGQSISIESNINIAENGKKLQKEELSQMLSAMQSGIRGKFYVRNIKTKLAPIGDIGITQTKLYRWKDLIGGVFIITNNTKKTQYLPLALFTERFDEVLTSFALKTPLASLESERIFIIQKINE